MANTRDIIGDKQTLDGLVSHTLTALADNRVITLYGETFREQNQLQSVNFPNLKTIKTNAFYNCSGLTELTFKSLENVETNAFYGCDNLKTFQTGKNKVTFGASFQNCNQLDSLIINSEEMSELVGSTLGSNNPIVNHNGAIYVPNNLVDEYRNSNWGKYFIFSKDDYPKTTLPKISDYNNYQYINDWEEVVNNQNYRDDYFIGDVLPIKVGDYGVIEMELIAMDTDIRADEDTSKNNGKARMTWMSKYSIGDNKMNDSSTNSNGWKNSSLRSYLRNSVLPLLPTIIKDNIVEVTKTYYDYTSNETKSVSDTIWIPSLRELFGASYNTPNTNESYGVEYNIRFYNDNSRPKDNVYWLRTASFYNSTNFLVLSHGQISYYRASYSEGTFLCFCI